MRILLTGHKGFIGSHVYEHLTRIGYDVIKGERVKIQGYLEDFALSKSEADELIMSARNIIYKN